MNCPACEGPMWDNRETKKNPKQPDFKCKDKACDKAVWLEKKGGSGAKAANGNGAAVPKADTGGPSRTASPLGPLYVECLVEAKTALAASGIKGLTGSDVLSAAATLFIAATREGRPVKAVAAAKPAAPAKARVTVPDEEFPGALEDAPDNLPFD